MPFVVAKLGGMALGQPAADIRRAHRIVEPMSAARPVITIYADILCPFTHVGLRTLVDQRKSIRALSPLLDLRAWPLELINGQPLDAHHIAAEISGLRKSVSPELFGGFKIETFAKTSMHAFRLSAAAAATSDLELSETIGLALRDAVFEHGLDIGDPAVIEAIAQPFGLPLLSELETHNAVSADWEAGKRRGVIGSPHLFVRNDAGSFCPALDIRRDTAGAFIIDWKPGAHELIAGLLHSR